MSRPDALSENQIKLELAKLSRWELKDGKIKKTFSFADFKQAFAFMTATALMAEQMNHHPEWFNVYNRVEVLLQTHDVAQSENPGLSELDFKLASYMDSIS